MTNRLDLHEILCGILGTRNVYFQPPASVKMQYPAIVYSLSDIKNKHADNQVYNQSHAYTITVVDKNPDSALVSKISTLPGCRFDRFYASDNLNHYVFTLHY